MIWVSFARMTRSLVRRRYLDPDGRCARPNPAPGLRGPRPHIRGRFGRRGPRSAARPAALGGHAARARLDAAVCAATPFPALGAARRARLLSAFALISPERSISSLTMPFVAALAAAGRVRARSQTGARRSRAGRAVVAAAAVVSYRSTRRYSDFFWTTLILTLAWFFGVRARHAHGAGTRAARARRGSRARARARGRTRDGRGARADRARAARRRRALRLGDGRAGLGRAAAAQGRPGPRARGAALRRADRPGGADRDAPHAGRDAERRGVPRRARAAARPRSTSTG